MEASLLQTKLYTPQTRPDLIPRPHLLERLNEGLQRKLILISAPAGFGKTTLLGAWINSIPETSSTDQATQHTSPTPYPSLPTPRFAWLSLDEGDNDPTRFLTYFITALQTLEASIGEAALAVLQASRPQPPLVESVLTTLINEITALSTQVVLILDDYHLIETSAIDQALTFLLDHLPAQMHLVIASRADPSLPLSRLRVRNQMTEIRADDLRFAPEEARVFLKLATGRDFSADDLAALEARTEGWIAGLQLAALSMQRLRREDDIPGFIAAFTGSHHYIVDYLVDEVISQQPEGTRDFLSQTSILSRLSGPLCDAVTGGSDGQARLEQLAEANLFLVPLDNERHWYRYHHLFADFLRARLHQNPPVHILQVGTKGGVAELHRRAAAWYEQHGFIAEAVKHLLSAGAFEQAVDLIERTARDLLIRGEHATVSGWIKALPEDLVRSRPRLCLAQVWALTYVRDTAGMAARLQDVEDVLRPAGTTGLTKTEIDHLQGEVAAYRAVLTFWHNKDLVEAIDLCQQALDKLPENDLYLRGMITFVLGVMYRANDDLATASQALTEACTINRKAGNLILALDASANLAGLFEVQGKLRQAAETHRQAVQLATPQHGRPLPAACYGLVGLGKVYREWNELDKASQYLHQALDLARQARFEHVVLDGTITLALVLQARGDWQTANETLEQAAQLAQGWNRARPIERVAVFKARLSLAQGRLEAAARWATESGLGIDDPLSDWLEPAHLILARVLLAQTKLAQALTLLARLRGAATSAGRTGSLIEILALQALAFNAQDDRAEAMTTLAEALTLAEPEGYIRLFVDEGQPMAGLLAQLPKNHYRNKLLDAFDEAEEIIVTLSPPHPHIPTLIEPLSERELEVLHLIATGMSNREIAQALIIAEGTVKKHTNNIFGKLGVRSRTQAVARATELNLL